MKITVLASGGKLDRYLEDVAFFLGSGGAESSFVPLESLNAPGPFSFLLPRRTRRFRALKRLLAARGGTDVLMINSSRMPFDLYDLREKFRGKIVIYDMEGPNFRGFADPGWISGVDLVITVSRYQERVLSRKFGNVRYLPHGVNPERFHRVEPAAEFLSPLAFVGRPSPHRNEYLSAAADLGLRLYGRKWRDPAIRVPDELRRCSGGVEVHGEALLGAISGCRAFVNILQDQYKDLKTLMNLQTFMVPACRGCLVTEFVEELPETFEPGREVVTFGSLEEFREQAERYSRDAAAAAAIAEAGFRRCMAEHTLRIRAGEMLKLISAL